MIMMPLASATIVGLALGVVVISPTNQSDYSSEFKSELNPICENFVGWTEEYERQAGNPPDLSGMGLFLEACMNIEP